MKHTLIVSDLHLTDAEPEHPTRPLWKKFKQKNFFIDQDFAQFLDKMKKDINGPVELILNGDIFDFDAVMSLPNPGFIRYRAFEGRRGLNSHEDKSLFKIEKILTEHEVWVKALRDFISPDHKIVFIIGNHDMELHWPQVQELIIKILNLPLELEKQVVFCSWFYLSENDTLIEHGNQFDPYCLCQDPVNPLIKMGKLPRIRLPFGNIANKFMINGMGLKNPHSEANFLMSTWDFVKFFVKYELRYQPFLVFVWLEGAIRTFFKSVSESMLPAVKDPFTVEKKIEVMSEKSQTTPAMLRFLREYRAHPAALNPFKILRELWLDRASFFFLIFWISFQFVSTANLFTRVSIWWFLVPLAIFIPAFALYASRVISDISANTEEAEKKIPIVCRAFKVKRYIQGHTHYLGHRKIDEIEYINTGTWSVVFEDPECTKSVGIQPFAWIKPEENGERNSRLYLWKKDHYNVFTSELPY